MNSKTSEICASDGNEIGSTDASKEHLLSRHDTTVIGSKLIDASNDNYIEFKAVA